MRPMRRRDHKARGINRTEWSCKGCGAVVEVRGAQHSVECARCWREPCGKCGPCLRGKDCAATIEAGVDR